MATVYRDFLSIPRAQQAGAQAVYKLFDQAWGKEWIDGVEVYTHGMPYVITNMLVASPQFMRFLKKIGITQESLLSKSYDGIEVALFWLNTGKVNFTPKLDVDIAVDISNAYNIGDEFEISVKYGGDLKRYVPSHWSTLPGGSVTVDTAAIRATLESDPLKYFANIETIPAGVMPHTTYPDPVFTYEPNTNITASTVPVVTMDYNPTTGKALDTLALLDNGSTFQQIGVRNEIFNAVETTDQYGNVAIIGEYSYIVKYRYIADPSSVSNIVTKCKVVADALAQSLAYTGVNKYKIVNQGVDTKIKEAIYSFNAYVSSNPIFYNGRLRVDAAKAMKKQDFVKILSKMFDHAETYTDNSHWYDVVIAIVIVIISIVIIVLTWYAGGSYGWVALGQGLAYGAAFMSVATMLYAAAFPDATSQIRALGKVAQIVGYMAAVTNIYNIAMSSSTIMQQASAVLQVGSVVADFTGNDELATILKVAAAGASYAGASDAFKDVTFTKLADGTASLSGAVDDFITEVTESLSELPQTIVDKISNIASASTLTDSSPISLGQVSGWMGNMNTAMNMYMSMFVTPYVQPIGATEQATKETGAEEYYAIKEMIDNADLLDKVDQIKMASFGAYQTEMFLSSIS